jgi:hypothetical protein
MTTIRAHLLYGSYVLRHKWFVLVAGIRLGPPAGWPVLGTLRWWLQLLMHDLSKFRPSEWSAYVDYFYGEPVEGCPKCKAARQAAFDAAWLHHQHRNLHHWQRWLLRNDTPVDRWTASVADRDGMVLLMNRPDGIRRFYLWDVFKEPDAFLRLLNSHPQPLPMPERYAREMVADWMGAGRAITGRWEAPKWYVENRHNMVLHQNTRGLVEFLLGVYRLVDSPEVSRIAS